MNFSEPRTIDPATNAVIAAINGQDADVFARAVEMFIDHQDIEARRTLPALSKEDPVPEPKFVVSLASGPFELAKVKPLSRAEKAKVYERDGWRCRYCSRKLVVPGILWLLTGISPGFKGIIAGHHMPGDRTEAAVERVYPNVDHILAVANGGSWSDDGNHATACTKCNARKSNWLGWKAGPIVRDEWDGLESAYRSLESRYNVDVAKAHQYHLDWFKALKV